jgi:hypothetical protein
MKDMGRLFSFSGLSMLTKLRKINKIVKRWQQKLHHETTHDRQDLIELLDELREVMNG